MKTVLYSADAAKALRRADRATAGRIIGKIEQLAESADSLAANVRTLRGSAMKRLRVGDWRVIFDETADTITVVTVAPRSRAYDQR